MSSALSAVAPALSFIPGVGPLAAAAAGGVGALLGAHQSAKNQNAATQAAGEQQQSIQFDQNLANQFLGQYQQASPYLSSLVNYFTNRAGLGQGGNAPGGNGVGLGGAGESFGTGAAPGAVTAVPLMSQPGVNGGAPYAGWGSRRTTPGATVVQAAGTPVGGGTPGLVNGSLGIFNSPQYQLALQQAQGTINHQAQLMGKDYTNQLTGRGLQNSSTAAGGQAAIAAGANKDYSDFTRNLAMTAADKQDQLAQQAMSALTPWLQAGSQAAGAIGQAGSMAGSAFGQQQGQANQLGQNLGTTLSNLAQNAALGGDGSDLAAAQNDPNIGTDAIGPLPKAAGGPVQAGHEYLTGERGPELFMPGKGKGAKSPTVNIPTEAFNAWLAHTIRGAAPPGRAAGGAVGSNQPYIVGENGPELMVPRQAGVIVPNGVLRGLDPYYLAFKKQFGG